MAKPKGKGLVGWGRSTAHQVLAEKDVNQTKNRKAKLGNTWSKGHIVRQLGVAALPIPDGKVYFVYTHSQVSNAGSSWEPPAYVGLTREDMEWLVAVFLRELSKPAE